MTYIEFRKILVELEITNPTFCEVVKINYKNLLSYKNKEEVPNVLASLATTFLAMEKNGIDYKEFMNSLQLEYKKSPNSGFAKNNKD